jgi:hypothetical protein
MDIGGYYSNLAKTTKYVRASQLVLKPCNNDFHKIDF